MLSLRRNTGRRSIALCRDSVTDVSRLYVSRLSCYLEHEIMKNSDFAAFVMLSLMALTVEIVVLSSLSIGSPKLGARCLLVPLADRPWGRTGDPAFPRGGI